MLANWQLGLSNAITRLENKITTYIEEISAISNFYLAYDRADRSNFKYLIGNILKKSPELYSLQWAPKMDESSKDEFIDKAKKDGVDYTIKKYSGKKPLYGKKDDTIFFPVYYSESCDVTYNDLGYDIYSDPELLEYIERTISTGKLEISDVLKFTNMQNALSIIMFFKPVFDNNLIDPSKSNQSNIKGIIVETFRVKDLFHDFVKGLEEKGIEIELLDNNSQNKTTIITSLDDKHQLLPSQAGSLADACKAD